MRGTACSLTKTAFLTITSLLKTPQGADSEGVRHSKHLIKHLGSPKHQAKETVQQPESTLAMEGTGADMKLTLLF